MFVALLLAFLVGGWRLGQLHSELVTARNDIIALQNQLTARDSELLSIKQQLKQTEGEARHFSSLEELEAWLATDDTDQIEYSGDKFNCIDFALMLQEHALADGYILSTEVLPVAAHWVNVAVIDDRIYIVEPQDDRIILEKTINRTE